MLRRHIKVRAIEWKTGWSGRNHPWFCSEAYAVYLLPPCIFQLWSVIFAMKESIILLFSLAVTFLNYIIFGDRISISLASYTSWPLIESFATVSTNFWSKSFIPSYCHFQFIFKVIYFAYLFQFFTPKPFPIASIYCKIASASWTKEGPHWL